MLQSIKTAIVEVNQALIADLMKGRVLIFSGVFTVSIITLFIWIFLSVINGIPHTFFNFVLVLGLLVVLALVGYWLVSVFHKLIRTLLK